MGLYKAWFKTRKEDNKQTTIVAYYATSPNNLPTAPGGNSKWYYDMVSLLPRNARSTSTVEKQRDKRCLPEEGGSMPTATAPTQKKKSRREEPILRNGATGHFVTTDDPERAMKQARPKGRVLRSRSKKPPQAETPLQETSQSSSQSSAVEQPPKTSWWDSTNAFSLFGERVDEDDEDAIEDDEDAWNVKAMVEK
jgi:hypothetical protein